MQSFLAFALESKIIWKTKDLQKTIMALFVKTVALRLSLLATHQEITVLNAYAQSMEMLCQGTEPIPVVELWTQ